MKKTEDVEKPAEFFFSDLYLVQRQETFIIVTLMTILLVQHIIFMAFYIQT